ncbi:MAG: hypothetical protein EOO86_04155 [Pedobacter sp.]|nr:MAG: hypothetical protein EOO86_04155 [Pedobacter sp.]
MTDDSIFTGLFTQQQIIGTIITVFGIALFALMLRRKYLRRRIQGLQKFAVTDRAPFSKRSENALQKIGVFLIVAGLITITVDAVRQADKAVAGKVSEISNT